MSHPLCFGAGTCSKTLDGSHSIRQNKPKPVHFTPVSPAKAVQHINDIWKSSPHLHNIRSPPPFVSSKTGRSYVSGRHVLLQEPRTYPEDAKSPIPLCYVAYNEPGVTTHSFLNAYKRPRAIAALGLSDEPDPKRPYLGEGEDHQQPAAGDTDTCH